MKFEDLSDAQLKKVIKNYRLHLLKELTGYSKMSRDDLINLCKKLFDIDDEKIKPKISEPIYFDIPKGRQPKVEKMKKVMKIKENKQTETISDKLINEFKKLSEEKKEEVIKELSSIGIAPQGELEYYKFVADYTATTFRKYYYKLLFGLDPKEYSVNYTNEGQYIRSIMPYLKNHPDVIASTKTRFYAKKEEILRPLMKELNDNYEENGRKAKIWNRMFGNISDAIRRSYD